MSSSDESPSRVGFRVHREWLQRLDQWRVNQPRTLTRTEAIRRLAELGLETESGKEVAKGTKNRSLSAAEADFYVHAKTISAFNGVLSILAVLVAKKLIDHNELSRIHESMSKPFSGKRDEGRSHMAAAQRRLDDVLARLDRGSLKPPKSK